MPPRTLSNLGSMVRKKRGDASLRDTALEIGISPATLMRVESGRIPDVATFGKLCQWLGVDPGTLLGFEKREDADAASPILVSAHLRTGKNPKPATVTALARMILYATKGQRASKEIGTGEDA